MMDKMKFTIKNSPLRPTCTVSIYIWMLESLANIFYNQSEESKNEANQNKPCGNL